MELFKGWAMLCVDFLETDAPEDFGFDILATSIEQAREINRKLVCEALTEHGYTVSLVNHSQIFAVLPDGQEVAYIFDVD